MPEEAGRKKTTIHLDSSEYSKFIQNFPTQGAFNWFVNESLKQFNLLNDFSMKELVGEAVKEVTLTEE